MRGDGRLVASLYCGSAAVLMGVLMMMSLAYGAPPPGTDPDSARALYFSRLMRPDTGTSCCTDSDCRPVEWRVQGDHYQAFLSDRFPGYEGAPRWIDIPPEKVLTQQPGDPEGEATMCWMASTGVLCFNPASGT